MDKTVAVFAKNSWEKVHVSLSEFRGRELVDIRIYWSPDGTNWHPSKKGVSIGIEKLPMLLAALHQAADFLGQDSPEPSERDDELLTSEEKGMLCDELKVEMDEIDNILGN